MRGAPEVGPGARSLMGPRVGPFSERFPLTAGQMRAVLGAGTWSSAYRLDEASGNLVDAFGAIGLTAVGTPRYREAGAYPGDFGIGFDDNTGDRFQAASNATFNLDAVTSLGIYICFRYDGTPSNRFLVSKVAFGDGYGILAPGGDGQVWAYIDGAVGSAVSEATSDHRGAFHDALMLIDRTDQRLQLVTDLDVGPARDISGVTTLSNAITFAIGAGGGGTTCGWRCAFAAVATGDINALRLGASTALTNIRRFTGRA